MSSSDASIHVLHNVAPLQSSLGEEESSKRLGRTPPSDYWSALLSSLSQLFTSQSVPALLPFLQELLQLVTS